MKTSLPCPRCGQKTQLQVRFDANFLRDKGIASNLFAAAGHRGITLKVVSLCASCATRVQEKYFGRKPAAKVSSAAATAPKPAQTFVCAGCNRPKSVEGSQTLPKMTRRCAECLPGAKLWGEKIGLFSKSEIPASAKPATKAMVATASKQ